VVAAGDTGGSTWAPTAARVRSRLPRSEAAVREFFGRYLQAWNAHDGPAAAAYMAEDAMYEDVAAAQVRHGRDEIASWVAEGERAPIQGRQRAEPLVAASKSSIRITPSSEGAS
jgi:hypothetical protein